jgi:hypothetical protein
VSAALDRLTGEPSLAGFWGSSTEQHMLASPRDQHSSVTWPQM